MSKRIKAIKCPHCGSTKVKETRPDYYQCEACSTDFFLDSDDININHHYIAPNDDPFQINKTKFLLMVFGIACLILLPTVIVKCLSSSTPSSSSGLFSSTPKEEEERFTTEPIKPFVAKDGRAVMAVFGTIKKGDYRNEKTDYLMRVFDIKKDKKIKELHLPVDKLNDVQSRTFNNGWINVVINKSTWYTIDPSSFELKEMTTYKTIPELQDGFASIELIDQSGDSEGFKVMTNLGKERYYLPLIGKVYTDRELYEACEAKLPNPTIETAFSFSKPTTEYPEQQIQLVKYTHYVQEGYPKTDYWSFGWCRDFGGKSGIFFGNAGSVKAFISTYSRQVARLINYSDFTPDAIYFSPKVIWFDKSQLFIRYKPTAKEDAEYIYQLLDANTAQRKWSIKAPAELDDDYIHYCVRSPEGFLISNYRCVWFLGNNGKTITVKKF